MSQVTNERLYTILIGPHVSEKSTVAADERRQVVFKVTKDAKKPEIKAAVEKIFDVEVEGVNVLNRKGKTKVFNQRRGKRSNEKLAFVTLKEGSDIGFLGAD